MEPLGFAVNMAVTIAVACFEPTGTSPSPGRYVGQEAIMEIAMRAFVIATAAAGLIASAAVASAGSATVPGAIVGGTPGAVVGGPVGAVVGGVTGAVVGSNMNVRARGYRTCLRDGYGYRHWRDR